MSLVMMIARQTLLWLLLLLLFLTPVLNSQGMKKLRYAIQKSTKNQVGMNLTPPPASQNSHAVRWHCTAASERRVAEIKKLLLLLLLLIGYSHEEIVAEIVAAIVGVTVRTSVYTKRLSTVVARLITRDNQQLRSIAATICPCKRPVRNSDGIFKM